MRFQRLLMILLLLPLLAFNVYAAKPNLVLLPIDVSEQDSDLEVEYGAALQEGLQNRYTVYYGASVEKELEKEYSKVDCDAETCNQNIAIAFNGELIADGAVKRIEGGYLLKLVVRNVLTSQVVETRTQPCKDCSQFTVINLLKKIGSGEKINNSVSRPPSNGRTQVQILESEAQTVSVKNAGQRGILIFDTQPSGVKIQINGEDKGITPYQGLDHKIGDSITILIDHEYYQSYELNVELQQAITQLENVILKNGQARLFVTSTPYIANGQVYINGERKGTAPLFVNVEAGEHNVQIKSKSQASIISIVKMTTGKQLNIDLPLTGSANTSTIKKDLAVLILDTKPEGMGVTYKGKKLGITPLQILNKTVGDSLNLTFDKKYHRSVTAKISLNEIINRVDSIKLSRDKGTVLITTTPFALEGEVMIDGKFYGKIPLNVELPSGEYEVQVKAPKQSTGKYSLEVNAGDNEPVSLSFGIQAGEIRKVNVAGAEFELVGIPAGSFRMGSNEDDDEKPIHTVNVPAFKMMTTEVTQGQWQAVMGNNPAKFKSCGDNCPVEKVSWNDVQGFIKKFNQKAGKVYRLPSEAEWEYAARAGSIKKYSWGGRIDCSKARYGYSSDECGKKMWTDPVKSFQPNAFGLYDMHGNVWEWTQDCWNTSYKGAPSDGSAWKAGNCGSAVVRGGSWNSLPTSLRSANRNGFGRAIRNLNFGFRLIQGQ
jgi:formylglycine-generating enzyme required for sulfatase activity